MAEERLSLAPFTNISNLVLNLSINPLQDQGVATGGGISSMGSRDSDSGHLAPTSSSAEGSEWGTCHDWQDAQHTLFQLANLCAAVSLLTPSSFRHHLLFLRCLFLVAFVLFVLWAGLFVCMLDVLVWNSVFFIVDFVHIICLAYKSIPSRFNPSLNELYAKKFKSLKVCRREFANLCNIGNVIPLRKGARYSSENVTLCGEKVSILLRGRLKASHDSVYLHSVEPNEFIDSPEFDSVAFHSDTSEKFQVTITAAEDSLIITWVYPTLRAYLASNPFLWTVFSNIVGKDVSDKLYKIQELLLREPENTNSSGLARNSSMVNVRKCLHSTDGRRPSFTNVPMHLSEPAMNVNSLQVVSATVETCV